MNIKSLGAGILTIIFWLVAIFWPNVMAGVFLFCIYVWFPFCWILAITKFFYKKFSERKK